MFQIAMKANGKQVLINMANVTYFEEVDSRSVEDGITPVVQHRVNFIDGSDFELDKDSYSHVVKTTLQSQIVEAQAKDNLLNALKSIEDCFSHVATRLEEIRDNIGYFLASISNG